MFTQFLVSSVFFKDFGHVVRQFFSVDVTFLCYNFLLSPIVYYVNCEFLITVVNSCDNKLSYLQLNDFNLG